MSVPIPPVILLDVDNTLLDNDRIEMDLKDHLESEFGSDCRRRYWEILESLREELGYADYLGALQRYRVANMHDPRLLLMSSFLVDYPFEQRLYPGALEAIRHLEGFGRTVILSDGDVVFQPRKVQRSGLWDAVQGRVLIYIHKETMLDAVCKRYPATHYVMIDDKLRILQAMKSVLGDRLTTVFARQGKYALDAKNVSDYAPADISVDSVRDVLDWDLCAPADPSSYGSATRIIGRHA